MLKAFCIKAVPILALLSFMTMGCVPESKNTVVVPDPHAPTLYVLPMERIEERIASLSKMLQEQKGSEEERETAKTIIDTYKTLQETSQGQAGSSENKKALEALFNNFSALEEKYFSHGRFEESVDTRALYRFSEEKERIMNLYLDGDYQGVINRCIELEATYGTNALTPEIGLFLSLSLAERGLYEEAVKIGSRIMRELEGKPDLMRLRANLIDWQLDLGDKEGASKIYEKLTDDIQDKEAIFKRAEERLKEKETQTALGGTASKLASIDTDVSEKGSLKEVLEEVDRLIKKHEYQDAKILLIKHRLTLEEGPDIETIDQALESVDLSEEKFHKEEIIKASQKNETLSSAMELIEEERFEEAITKLETFEDAQEMSSETGRLKGFAIDKLINRERNKAARLFLMAKNTEDPARKEELLVSSYDLLKVLADNYPSSPLNDKINDHMEKIKRELDKLSEGSE